MTRMLTMFTLIAKDVLYATLATYFRQEQLTDRSVGMSVNVKAKLLYLDTVMIKSSEREKIFQINWK